LAGDCTANQSRAEGWNIVILVLMEVIRSMIHRRESVLNSRVWVIAVIAVGAIIALVVGIGIYVYIQMQQGVII
jgi:hypothetical protein